MGNGKRHSWQGDWLQPQMVPKRRIRRFSMDILMESRMKMVEMR